MLTINVYLFRKCTGTYFPGAFFVASPAGLSVLAVPDDDIGRASSAGDESLPT